MTTKTPVSRLQEISMKMKLAPPEYEIIFSRAEGTNPSFTYQCNFNGKSAEGTGRTKRDAKHESADALLRLLESDGEANETILKVVPDSVVLPHGNKVQRNFVGDLAAFCLEILNFTERPIYAEIGASGAAHDPTFTMRCTVSNFSAEAKGPTKKQAKQLAAKLVLERLQPLKDSEKFSEVEKNSLLDLSDMSQSEKATIKSILALHKPALPKLENINKTNEIFKQLHYKDVPILKNYPEEMTKENWNPYTTLREVCDLLGEDMLSFYKFRKTKVESPKKHTELDISHESIEDMEISLNNSLEMDNEVYYTCLTTVHVRPMNLTCKGIGSSLEICIGNAAKHMMFLLYCFMYDEPPCLSVGAEQKGI